ncbi:unnamed protein product [Schistosoma margrebowiei]|uniref:Uncharacterized protein n=1 Tax=Schistosoma margrebowiei TaxID=48269 RepID=A0A183N0J9_9TREM|nr:unnamed protein product [Schistosoma margrebowiei]
MQTTDHIKKANWMKAQQQQMQEKTSVAAASAAVDVKTFTYLGSIINEHGGSDADVKARIVKARAAYLQLKNI